MATTRVANSTLRDSFISQIFDTRAALEKMREQVSSGLKVAVPSDDPGRAGTLVELQNILARLDKHEQRISSAEGFLGIQDAILEQASDIMIRAKELATQAANETVNSDVRQNLAQEAFALRDALVNLANTKYNSVYIYGGADDDDPPFDTNTGVNGYASPASVTNQAHALTTFDGENGTGTTRNVQISDTENVRLNSQGDLVFLNSIVSLERLGRSLAGYETTLVDRGDGIMIPDGTGDAYTFPTDYHTQTQDLRAIIESINSAVTNDIGIERSSVGSRVNALTRGREIIQTLAFNTEKSRASLQDADIFESATKLADLQNSLEALLTSGARINNISLLNFL